MADRDVMFILNSKPMNDPEQENGRLLRPHTSPTKRSRQPASESQQYARQPLAPMTMTPTERNNNTTINNGLMGRNKHPRLLSAVSSSMPLPKLNRFKDKHPGLFDKGGGRRSKHAGGQTALNPPTAWGESRDDFVTSSGQVDLGPLTVKRRRPGVSHIGTKQNRSVAFVTTALQSVQKTLNQQQLDCTASEGIQRRLIIQNANSMVHGLPIQYLFAKPELRRYALEIVFDRVLVLVLQRERAMTKRAFATWKTPPEILCDDRQIGFVVVAQAFQQLLDRVVKRAFSHWSVFYASRYNEMRSMVMNQAATDIQRWYRDRQQTRRVSYQRLLHAMAICVQRRQAIKAMIVYEGWYRKAQIKLVKAIAHRRRRHMAARSIQRIYRWVKRDRRVMWKLIRLGAVRVLQRFWRMELARDTQDHVLIKAVIRAGGYSKVMKKVPPKLMGKGNLLMDPKKLLGMVSVQGKTSSMKSRRRKKDAMTPGFLAAFDGCVRTVQRAWMRYKGKGALLEKMQARAEEAAREAILVECAEVIQNSYRAHLWDRLMLATTQHNRARRIQRAFRAYQYRSWIVHQFLTRRRHIRLARNKRTRERFLRRALLWAKFALRGRYLEEQRAAQDDAAGVIARCYRAAKERRRVAALKEAERRRQLREAGGEAAAIVSKIQRNWRQTRPTCAARFDKRFTESRFALHVKLLAINLERKRRLRLFKAAYKIQKLARAYLDYLYHRDQQRRAAALVTLYRLFKAGWLRLAVHRRVVTKRALKHTRSNTLKYWWRKVLFRHGMKGRFYLMRERLDNEQWVAQVATRLQRFLHQKWWEYYAPMRVVARYEIKKRLEREEAQRIWDERDRAARGIQKALRGNRTWRRNLRRIGQERTYYRRHNAARAIQKFFKMVVAWSRFWTAADARIARKEAEELRRRYHEAANVVGFFYRRWREKKVLQTMFRMRRKMLDEYYHLTDVRLKAEADRQDALDEVQRSEETMMATVASAWRQGSDTVGRNYFYNYITGESSWQPPEAWKVKPSEMWVRNKDDRDNVYYYNMQTGESRWLPPCCLCGVGSERWCVDCGVGFCLGCYDTQHVSDRMQAHEWSNMEMEKEALRPGEAHCCECKKRVAKVVCTTCWDPYCAECFRYVHHTGALKDHVPVNYKKAKAGWSCIKAKVEGDRDYFVHGTTGETTYDKPEGGCSPYPHPHLSPSPLPLLSTTPVHHTPFPHPLYFTIILTWLHHHPIHTRPPPPTPIITELMTAQEKVYYQNFKTHQTAAEDQVKQIDKLQVDLEAASYERDTIMFDAINGTGKIGQLLKNRQKQANKGKEGVKAALPGGPPKKKNIFQRLFGGTREEDEYRAMLLASNPRERGQARDAYIQEIIDGATGEGGGAEKTDNR